MRVIFILPLLLLGCGSDNEIQIQRKEIRTDQNTYDAGVIAVGDRYTFPVILQSVGPGSITIYDIQSSDPEHFVILPSWKEDDTDGDGTPDSLTLMGGTKDNPTQDILEVNFRPDSEELFRGKIIILSNDTTTKEQTEEGYGIWRSAIRGIGKIPCANVFPKFIDFGSRPAGGYFSEEIQINNCGEAPITVSSFQFENSTSFYGASATPMYIFPGENKKADIAWVPGDTNQETANLILVVNDPDLVEPIPLLGNSCEESVLEDWDADADGWTICGGDCNDDNDEINPSVIEIPTNNKDDNCNELIDEEIDSASDDDVDGFSEDMGDCHDDDPNIYPGAVELINQIDDNCDGLIDNETEYYDDDGDGLSEREGDCDDSNAEVHPDQEEIVNEIDDNCNQQVDENSPSFDDDGDGYSEDDGDCDDEDPWTWPTSIEDCDTIDNDCDGVIDEGEDDEENGACSFIVERETSNDLEDKGCSSVSAKEPHWLLLILIAVGLRRKTTK
jgi:hypothetical protein